LAIVTTAVVADIDSSYPTRMKVGDGNNFQRTGMDRRCYFEKGLVCLMLFLSFCLGNTQEIPLSPSEYSLQVGNRDSGVRVEFFVDLACSDSKAAWTVLLETAAYYKEDALFLIHLFPLPYHTLAFTAAKAVVVVWKHLGIEAALGAMNVLFAKQEKFLINDEDKKGKTLDSYNDAIEKLILGKTLGLSAEEYEAGMADPKLEHFTRAMWKYGSSRGVTGAPQYFVNGVQLAGEGAPGSEASLADWQAVLDPVVHAAAGALAAGAPGNKNVLPHTRVDEVLSDAAQIKGSSTKTKTMPTFGDNGRFEARVMGALAGGLFLAGVAYIALVVLRNAPRPFRRPASDHRGEARAASAGGSEGGEDWKKAGGRRLLPGGGGAAV